MAGTARTTQKGTPREIRTMREELNKVITDLETLRGQLARVIAAPTNLMSTPGLAIGSTPANVSNIAFTYRIAGVTYAKAAVAAGTAPGNDVVPEDLYGAVAFDIGADGTVDAVEASANATGYATPALAVAGLPAVAAGHVRMGYVTAMKSDGAFTFGTTSLAAANTTVAYTSVTPDTAIAAAGLTAATVNA